MRGSMMDSKVPEADQDTLVSILEHLPPKVAINEPLTEFHLFPKLPVEQQHVVWSFCRPDAQAVIIKEKTDFWLTVAKYPYRRGLDWRIPAISKGAIPSLLHTCQQSRTFALQHWYPYTHPNKLDKWNRGLTYFFNPQIDAVLIDGGTTSETDYYNYNKNLKCITFTFKKCIRRLVVRHIQLSAPSLTCFLIDFPNIEEVVLLDYTGSLDSGVIDFEDLEDSATVFDWQRSRSIAQWAEKEFEGYGKLYGDRMVSCEYGHSLYRY